jgi:maltose alpha-D-glucosyltransferase / alpha-amylase
VLPEGWQSLLPERAERPRTAYRALTLLAERVLPSYLGPRRCRTRHCALPAELRVEAAEPWRDRLLLLLRLTQASGVGPAERLFLPLAIQWQQGDAELPTVPSAATTLAQVRRHATPGYLYEAFADAGFVQALVRDIGAGATLPLGAGALHLRPTGAFAELAAEGLDAPVQMLIEDADNGAVLGDRLLLKTLHCVVETETETEPEPATEASAARVEPLVEIGRHLTEVARFAGVPALAGHVDHAEPTGPGCTLALLEQFVPNQGDLAGRIQTLLRRLCDEHFCARGDDSWREDPGQISFEGLIARAGTRLAELHGALAVPDGNPAFRPERHAAADAGAFRQRLRAAVADVLGRLEARQQTMAERERSLADALLVEQQRIDGLLDAWSAAGLGPVRCRVHGDLRLERVLVAGEDVVFIGAGGPADRPPAPRRRKLPPLSDLGRLLAACHETVAEVAEAMDTEHPDLGGRLGEPITRWRRDMLGLLVSAYAAAATEPVLPAGGDAELMQKAPWLFALDAALRRLDAALTQSPERTATALGAMLSLLRDGAEATAPG